MTSRDWAKLGFFLVKMAGSVCSYSGPSVLIYLHILDRTIPWHTLTSNIKLAEFLYGDWPKRKTPGTGLPVSTFYRSRTSLLKRNIIGILDGSYYYINSRGVIMVALGNMVSQDVVSAEYFEDIRNLYYTVTEEFERKGIACVPIDSEYDMVDSNAV